MKYLIVVFSFFTCSLVYPDAIDDFVEAERKQQNIPGIAIGIFNNGQIIKAQGYGFANLEHQVPVQPNTLFEIASISKMFTGLAVMALVEDGVLDLDTSIRTYLPDAPKGWKDITLRHLLNHTAGLGHHDLNYQAEYSDEELLKHFYSLKRRFPAGQRWEYSNLAYTTAGIIIKKSQWKALL